MPSILDDATDSARRRKRARPPGHMGGAGIVQPADGGFGVGDVGGYIARDCQDPPGEQVRQIRVIVAPPSISTAHPPQTLRSSASATLTPSIS